VIRDLHTCFFTPFAWATAVLFCSPKKEQMKGSVMLNTKTTLMALISAAALTACGGGGGDGGTTVDARVKYVGTWLEECISIPLGVQTRYQREQVVIALQGESDLVATSTDLFYSDPACTQPAASGTGNPDRTTFTFTGSTKTLADGKVVDKVLAAFPDMPPGKTLPAILYTADNKRYIQANAPDEPAPVPVDSEGFPNVIDPDSYATKVSN
jgi:hypothetical protein